MSLNISNPTHQRHIFLYREPVNNLELHAFIQPGAQIEIGQHWTAEQQAKVIRQLETHGARDAAEVHGDLGRFSGLLYRDRGVISVEEIHAAHESDITTREERSVSEATLGALAFDRAARTGTSERPPATLTESIVQQDVQRGQKRKKGDTVDFSMTVSPDGAKDARLPIMKG